MAVGSAVCHGDWLGLFDIAVCPEMRAQGLGTALTQHLLAWGTTLGVRRAYLQVGADNGPAKHLYAKLGFARLYDYHYRQQRLAAGPA